MLDQKNYNKEYYQIHKAERREYYQKHKEEIKRKKEGSGSHQYTKSVYCYTNEHVTISIQIGYNPKTDYIGFQSTKFEKSQGYSGRSETNKQCSQYLGITIAETVLSKVFSDVKRMSINNPGYDFICNKGFKIDVKSGIIRKQTYSWMFTIKRNQIADYFLCLAFDNRKNLNPLHIWLIPSNKVSHLMGFGISNAKLNKWSKYELEVDKVISCCNTLKGGV